MGRGCWGAVTAVGKRRKPQKTSNMVLALLSVFLLAFIVCMIVIFCVKGSVPDTLIQYTLGSGGVECVVLAGIKISKIIAGEKPEKGENDERPFL